MPDPHLFVRSVSLFVLAGLCEIAGGWLIWNGSQSQPTVQPHICANRHYLSLYCGSQNPVGEVAVSSLGCDGSVDPTQCMRIDRGGHVDSVVRREFVDRAKIFGNGLSKFAFQLFIRQ